MFVHKVQSNFLSIRELYVQLTEIKHERETAIKKSKNSELALQSSAKRKLGIKNNIDAWILMLPMVVILYLFVWRPTVMSMAWSFFNMKAYTVKDFCGFDNYIKVLTHTQFLPMLWNTVQYVLWSLVIGFFPPLFIAIMINEIVHFKGGFRVLIYIPAVIPGIAAMLMWYFMYYPDSQYDNCKIRR